MKNQRGTRRLVARPNWHQTLYAYHEAGHAVVGHVIGRCIGAVSIRRDKERGYRGYCLFNTFGESVHDMNQWNPRFANPDHICIMYGGTLAMQGICEERGWNYDYWRKGDMEDGVRINQMSVDLVGEGEADQYYLQLACRSHARNILENNWSAVSSLATELETRAQIIGGEVHRIIQESIDPSYRDWRMEETGEGVLEFYGME